MDMRRHGNTDVFMLSIYNDNNVSNYDAIVRGFDKMNKDFQKNGKLSSPDYIGEAKN